MSITTNPFPETDRGDKSITNLRKAKKALPWTGIRRHTVLYLKGGKELSTNWFNSKVLAERALGILKGKGYRAIIYIN